MNQVSSQRWLATVLGRVGFVDMCRRGFCLPPVCGVQPLGRTIPPAHAPATCSRSRPMAGARTNMPNQRIQFQPSMLMPEFQRCFGTEVQCTEAVKPARRPDGFRCPRCAIAEHYAVGRGSENKVPFVAAVSVDSNGPPLYVKLNLNSGFTSKAISKWGVQPDAGNACDQ